MSKKILFWNTSKLATLSAVLLLLVFGTISMSFAPAEEDGEMVEQNDSTSTVTRTIRKSHADGGQCGSDHTKKDYGKAVAVTKGGGGKVTLTSPSGGGVIATTTPTSGESTSADGNSVTIVWHCNNETKTGTEAQHRRSFTWTAIVTDTENYKFDGWGTSTSSSSIDKTKAQSFTEEMYIDDWNGDSGSHESEGNALTKTYYAFFSQKVAVTITMPVTEHGSYTYSCSNGSGSIDGTHNGSVTTKNEVTFTTTPASGYKFFGWYTLSGTKENYISFEKTWTKAFDADITIYAKFIPSADAAYLIKGTSDYYTDFSQAITAASSSSSKVLLPCIDGAVPAGSYTIPSTVTLLVPFDDAYAVYTTTPASVYGGTVTNGAYRTLSLASGVSLTVNGKISIGGKQYGTQPYGGCVTGKHGRLHLKGDATITLKSGSYLYCWGYLTGDKDASTGKEAGQIIAESGSSVYEGFQVTCWRGGTAASSLNGNSKNVFPLAQYYIQNIETPITFMSGASETIYTGVTANGEVNSSSAKLVGKTDGLFKLSSGQMTRWFNAKNDRQMYELSGNTELASISVTVYVTVNSASYVLPLTNNMDISVKSGTLSCNQKVAILPGAKITIDEGANVSFGSSSELYVYDKDEWPNDGTSAFNYPNKSFNKVPYYPTAITTARTYANMTDAIMDINGTFTTASGHFYTTTGKAEIISSGGTGKVVFSKAAQSNNSTYQATQSGSSISYTTIAITPAQLKNGNGTYVATAGSAAGTTYTYCGGFWITDPCTNGTITWKSEDGNTTLETDANQSFGTATAYNGATPTKAQTAQYTYTFDGWTTAANGGGTYYANGSTPNVSGDATYYAHFSQTPRSYTLAWSTDGDALTGSYSSGTIAYGTTITAPNTPTKTGYTFNAWTPTFTGTMPAANTTYTATWNVTNYTISYNLDGGTATNPTSYTITSAAITLTNPTKTGYTFVGWTGTGLASATTNVTIAKGSTGNRSYTATWTPNTNTAYTVKHYKQNVDGTYPATPDDTDNLTGTTGASVTPDRKSYTGFTAPAGQTVTILADGSRVVTYQYTRNTYRLTWNLAGGTVSVAGTGAAVNATGSPYSDVKFGATITVPTVTRAGYSFVSWDATPVATMPTEPKTYTATWDIVNYTITYNLDGGSVATPNPTSYDVTSAAFTLNNPTKTGYTFAGWTGTGLSGATTTVTIANGSTGNRSYIATWTPNTNTAYTVKHYKQELDGTYAVTPDETDNLTGTTGASVTPARKSYTGFTAPAGQTVTILANGSRVVEYYYTRDSYTLSWETDGDALTGSYTSGSVKYEAPITAPNEPTKAGHTFKAWTPAVAATMPATNTTYTATWTINKYDITFANIDGNGATQVENVEYGTSAATLATLVTPEKVTDCETYPFTGWSPELATVTGATTYTAQFSNTPEVTQFTVTFNVQGHGVAPANQTIDCNEHASKPANPSETGYTFGGWYKEAGCINAWNFESDVVARNTTIYAYWLINSYTISFDVRGGSTVAPITQNYNTTITAPANPTKQGYTFAGWSPDVPATMPGSDMTCEAQWTPNTNTAYTVKHFKQNLDGSYPASPTETDNLTGTTLTDVTPARKSYEGFTAPAAQTVAIYPDGSMHIDYYYTRNSYTLAWTTDGDALTGSYTTGSVKYGAAITAPNTPTKTGYTFNAWTPAVTGTMPAGNTTYTATWTPNANTAYTVKHYKQNLDGSYPASPDDTDNLTGTTATNVTPARKSYEGFTAPAAQTVSILADGSRVVTYNYTRNSYTLTWNANGGAIAGTSHTSGSVKYGATITAPENANVTRDHYTFAGWNTTPAATMPATNTTYTAQWMADTYTVTLNTNGGTINAGNVTSYTYGVGATLPTNIFHPSGWDFAGWYDNSECTGSAITSISTTATGNKEFWAKWDETDPLLVATVTPAGSTTATKYKATADNATAITTAWNNALNAAKNDATGGCTLTLYRDVTLSAQQTINKAMTLDLNGCTITCTTNSVTTLFYISGVAMTVNDSKGNGKINYSISGNSGIALFDVYNTGGTITINGGTFISTNNQNNQNAYVIYHNNGNNNGASYINGGELRATSKNYARTVYTYNTNQKVYVTGGKIYAKGSSDNRSVIFNNAPASISGGYFSKDQNLNNIVTGYEKISKTQDPSDPEWGSDYNYKVCPKKYTIIFKDGDGNTLTNAAAPHANNQWDYGTNPYYEGTTPTKAETAQYRYVFNNTWSPEIATVSANAEYTAQFDQQLRSYNITFANVDGNGAQRVVEVEFGETPVCPVTPEKYDEHYSYAFLGWSPTITSVTGEKTYTATFSEYGTPRTHEVTFDPANGETPIVIPIAYGEMAEWPYEDPEKDADAQYTYTFTGWSPTFTTVTEATTYTAQYASSLRSYNITFVDHSETTVLENVAYGITPSVSDPSNYTEGGKNYFFTGWSPAIAPVSGEATYTAQYIAGDVVATVTTAAGVTTPYTVWDGNTGALAAANASAGSTLKLYKNVTATNNSEIKQSFTLDLNGHTISCSTNTTTNNQTRLFYINGAYTLTITDSGNGGTISYTGTGTASYYAIDVNNTSAVLTVEDGIIQASRTSATGSSGGWNATTYYAAAVRLYNTNSTLNLNGGELLVTATSGNSYAVYHDGGSNYGYTNISAGKLKASTDIIYSVSTARDVASGGYYSKDPGNLTVVSGYKKADVTSAEPELAQGYTKKIVKSICTIVWKNEDGTQTLETDNNINAGTATSFDGETPTKAANALYTYTFDGWATEANGEKVYNNGETPVAGENVTYYAHFSSELRLYTILWKNTDGTETLETDNVSYGTASVFNGETPTKAGNAQYTYTFVGWTTEANGGGIFYPTGSTPAVEGDATYYVDFSSTINQYAITWKNLDGNGAQQVEDVEYGQIPVSPVVPEKYTEYGSYAWTGWTDGVNTYSTTDALPTVTGAAEYTATFSDVLTPRTHTITFDPANGEEPHALVFAYGATPAWDAAAPTKDADAQYTYAFNGWKRQSTDVTYAPNETLPTVSGQETYTAQYATTLRNYTITWKNWDGSTIKTDVVAYGEIPSYSGATPTRPIANGLRYTFTGWSPSLKAVNRDAAYTAQYSSTTCVATVTTTANVTTPYDNWPDALAAANSNANCILTLYANVTPDVGTSISQNMTLDLNGCTMSNSTSATQASLIVVTSALTIKDTKGGGEISFTESANTNNQTIVVSGGSLTLQGGTIKAYNTNTGTSSYAIATFVQSSGTLTVQGGELIANGGYNAYVVYNNQTNVTVTGGKFKSIGDTDARSYIFLTAGNVTASGGYYSKNKDNIGNINLSSGFTKVNVSNTEPEYAEGYYGKVVKGTCTITWKNWNGTNLVEPQTVNGGAATSYPGSTPTKAADAQYTYTFDGWSTELNGDKVYEIGGTPAATTDATYYAHYSSAVNSYVITWKDGDGNTIHQYPWQYGQTPTYNSATTPTKTSDDYYDYTFNGTWSPAIVAVTGEAIYTAQFNSAARIYSVTLNTNEGTILAGNVTSYTYGVGATLPNATYVTREGYTFDGWYDNSGLTGSAVTAIADDATGDKQFWAKWTLAAVDRELDIVDWTSNSIVINVTNFKTLANKNDWKIRVNGVDYSKSDCNTTTRTLTVTGLTLTANENLLVQVKNGSDIVESYHNYTIPFLYSSNATLSGTTSTSVVYVYGGKLTMSGNTTLAALYVCPGAEVNVTGTLTVGKLVLRTKPWATAAISGSVSATNIYYTRIAPDGSDSYPTGQYYQFGLPYDCAISAVRLSDGTTPAYSTTWLLKNYNEETRALNGADGNNWDALASSATIEAGRGYEMFSSVKYYREYYFPVTPTDNTSVAVTRHGDDKNNSGWNIICSPLMSVYENTSDPVTGAKVSWLLTDGSYDQVWPETIWPALPFSYQASANGTLDFSSTDFNQTVNAAPRRAAEETTETEWLHVDLKDMNEAGDHTSLFVHPSRFAETYETGIDVAKQSLTASRAIIYSSHAYGDMAFAGVSDASLEQGVALTVYSPKAQELTISMRENDWLNRMAFVWLIDQATGAQIDLLESDYSFNAEAGTTAGRFILMGAFFAPQITTDNGTAQSDDEDIKVTKFIYNDKMYIQINGVIYDATGKLVK